MAFLTSRCVGAQTRAAQRRTLDHMIGMSVFGRMLLAGVLFASVSPALWASEEAADRRTQDALGLDANPGRGALPFDRYCSSCHGKSAQGDAERVIPALAGQRFDYLVRQIANFRSAERDSAAMYHVVSNKAFAEPQMWDDVAAYLSRLPTSPPRSTGDGTKAALGQGIFREQCASCHQADAGGDKEGFVPSLRNQHYPYLVNQMHRLADGHRHDVDPSLVLFLRSFDDNDIAGVADFLSRLQGAGRDHSRMLGNGVVVD